MKMPSRIMPSSPELPLALHAKLELRARSNRRSVAREILAIVTEVLTQDELHPVQDLTQAILQS